MSHMWQQNSCPNQKRHRIEKLSALLSKMQSRKFNWSKKFKNNRNYPIKILCSVQNGIANFQIYGLKTDNDYEVVISNRVTGTTSNAIYSEAYKILKQNGQVVSSTLLSQDVYKRH